MAEAGAYVAGELTAVGIAAESPGRAEHFYFHLREDDPKGKEFNECWTLTAMRVRSIRIRDCYGAVGIIHSLWKPMPGRFKDYIAVPKPDMYQSLRATVVGREGPAGWRSRSAPRTCTARRVCGGAAGCTRTACGFGGSTPGSTT